MAILVRKATEQEAEDFQKLDQKTLSEGSYDWFYDEKTFCYFVVGAAKVDENGAMVSIQTGDLVTFPAGLNCTWHVEHPVKVYVRHRA